MLRLTSLALCALVVLCMAPLAWAWPTDPISGVTVASGSQDQDSHAMLADGSGGAFVCWTDYSANTGDIYAKHLLATGVVDPAWPAGGTPVCVFPTSQFQAVMVLDGSGGFIVAWTDFRTDTDIYAQHVLGSGAVDPAWPANGRLVTVAGQQSYPSIASDGAGGAIVAWEDVSGPYRVYAQHLKANGTLDPGWPASGTAVCALSLGQILPVVVSDGAGGGVVVWEDQRAAPSDVYAQHILSSGAVDGAWPADGRGLCTALNAQTSIRAIADGAGGALVSWKDQRAGGLDYHIYAHHVLASGAVDPAWPADGRAVCTAAGGQDHPVICSDGGTGAILAWDDFRTGNADIYAHHVLGSGAVDGAWPANGRIVTGAANDQTRPSLVRDGAGGAIVAWQDDWVLGVYAHHVLSTGTVDATWPVGGRRVCTANVYLELPQVVSDGAGGGIIAWRDLTNPNVEIHAERVTRTSSLGVDFTDAGASLPGAFRAALAWGDYDGDGDLDLLISGVNGGSTTALMRNTGGTFANAAAGLPGLEWCSLAWGDYDGDGDLDLALAGYSNGPLITRVYRNDAGVFTDIGAGLTGVIAGSVTWADYDNDGDLDLLVVGQDVSATPIARLYRNDHGTFTNVATSITGVYHCDAAWGDYDKDGDLDLVIAGTTGTNVGLTKVYRNDAGTLVDSGMSLTGVWEGDVAWADFDADGDLDLLVCGWDGTTRHFDIYRNSGGVLSVIGSHPAGLSSAAAAWGDYDSDGDLDIASAGYWDGSAGLSRVYRDSTADFPNASMGLSGLYYSAVAFGDYDNDGDLDLAISGTPNGVSPISVLYRAGGVTPNLAPSPPAGLSAVRSGSQVTFSWAPGSDDHTPADALSYNLRIGTTPGGNEVMPAMSAAGGYRRVPRLGNVQEQTSWTLTLPVVPYYWSVQSVDGAFLGSTFASGPPVAGVEGDAGLAVAGLRAPFPNPFHVGATISFEMPREARTRIRVFDASGRLVRTLADGPWSAGAHQVRWDGRDDRGHALPSGSYLVRMSSAGRDWGRKIVLAR